MPKPLQQQPGASVRRRALVVGIVGVLASAVVLAGGTIWASRQLDGLQGRNETKIVAHTVNEIYSMLQKNVHDYAWSDDAALRANLVLDWTSAQIGMMFWTSWGYDYVFAVAEDGTTSYGLVDGQVTDQAAVDYLGPELNRLIARTHIVAGEPVAITTTVAVDRNLIAVAAAQITWRTATAVAGRPQIVHLVLGKRLDRRLLDELSGDLEIREPHLRINTGADVGTGVGTWALLGPLGSPVAVIDWKPARPGARALGSLTPPMVGAFAVLLLSALVAGSVLVRADRRRCASEHRFRDFANAVSDWLWETDPAGRFRFVSRRFAELAELDPDGLVGRTHTELGLHRNDDPVNWARLHDEMERRLPIRDFRYQYRTGSGRLCHFRISGRPFYDERGRFLGYRGAGSDVTQEVEAECRLTFLAKHDALTELPNRALLNERLRQDLARASRDGPLAVLCVDLDRFKEVNDLNGHAAGDAVLREVAGRLRETLRSHDTAARLGGDEFVVILPGVGTAADAVRIAERLVARLSEPYADGASDTAVGASIGVALCPSNGDTADRLLRCADMALYRAKAEGRGRVCLYAPEMDARLRQRWHLERELKTALQREGDLVMHYQPTFDLVEDRLVGFEALVRWKHRRRGMIPPGEFIPLAEETGLIVPLGSWVLRQACRDARRWPGQLKVAVNLSVVQFRQRDLVEQVAAILEATGLDPARLELEITESVLIQDTDAVLQALGRLKAMGVRIAMDDFGTGYSSLSYLRHFSFDKIKIDRSFVNDIEERTDAQAVVEAALGLGHNLGMITVAEGVENDAQMARLRAMGCRQVQGFHCGRPMPASDVQAALTTPSTAGSLQGWMRLTGRRQSERSPQLIAAE